MALFGGNKKKEDVAQIPLDQVMALRQQGYSNDQIIQSLQGQGFNQPGPAAPQGKFSTPADVKAAVQGGKLTSQAGAQILRTSFGFK